MIAAGTASATPAASGSAQAASDSGLGNIGTAIALNGLSSAISAAGQTVSGIFNYIGQNALLDIRKDAAISRYDHQGKMATINKEMQFDILEHKEATMKAVKEGKEGLNKAVYDRKKAEDGLIKAKAKGKQMELTKKTGKPNKKALDKLFGQYGYGKPFA